MTGYDTHNLWQIEESMTQDQLTGAAADEWGRKTARAIASELGAEMKSKTSNEATFKGKNTVIKCAAPATDSVGVTFKMLDRIDSIVAAFQRDDGSFELWCLPAEKFRSEMRDTRSTGASAGKVGLVRKDVFERQGRLITRITL
jgi:hypothetical protein